MSMGNRFLDESLDKHITGNYGEDNVMPEEEEKPELKPLRINDLVMLEGRVYRVEWSKWQNGKMQGNRAILKLLREKELMELVISQQEK